ncbi:hypothetical protein VTK56DRAFT_4063 [Thermocarpiscus australiensis]
MATLSNTTLAASSLSNPSGSTSQITGWVSTDTHRGSIDILWSCCITIVLCCWVSTFPNVPSLKDKWCHALVDKFNLACVGFLGPDLLLLAALGQLSSARRSVKLFRELPRSPDREAWTLVHGFFANMGGFHLDGPDYPPFPLNAEQLHYLVKHGHVDFPKLSKLDIKASNKTDGLSKLITLWQVFWFSVSELQRAREGLPMTTFELTALSFSLTMLVTSLCWYAKPTISRPTMLKTKDGRTIESIRAMARDSTHPGLSSTWYRTPLDFVSPTRRFRVDMHWSYYARLTELLHIPVFSRRITARPWDRLPSYEWLVIDPALLVAASPVLTAFSVSPLIAWNFYFPTEGEKITWRVCSIYHVLYSGGTGLYLVYSHIRETRKAVSVRVRAAIPTPSRPEMQSHERTETPTATAVCSSKAPFDVETGVVFSEQVGARFKRAVQVGSNWLKSLRNISPDGDPDMELPLYIIIPFLPATFLYILCRVFFYVEDFVSIRQQPVGAYTAMNKFLPFMS